MDLTKWKEKTTEALGAAAGIFGTFPAALGNFRDLLTDNIIAFTGRLLDRFPEQKRRPILFVFGGITALFFILVVILILNSREPEKKAAVDMAASPVIPEGELFIPSEPDFLPGVLLEREPRSSWSIEDIRPYWRSPGNPEIWRGEIKSAVDKLMEDVP